MASSNRNIVTDEKKEENASNSVIDDAVLWSENPEKAYFQSMMHEKEMDRLASGKATDDSIVGNETLASLMEEGKHKARPSQQETDMTKFVPDDDEDDSMKDNPNAPFNMAIVGLEDDLSTLANDSVAGKQIDLLRSVADYNNTGEAQVTKRDFKEYTPERKKRTDSDEATAPETPPGMIRVANKDGDSKGNVGKTDQFDDEKYVGASGMSERSKKIYIGALILACLLLASVIGLAVALGQLRSEESQETTPIQYTDDEPNFPTGFLTAPPIDPTITAAPIDVNPTTPAPYFPPTFAPVARTSDPIEEEPTVAPVVTPGPVSTPAPVSTLAPVNPPTDLPTIAPVAPTEFPSPAPVTDAPSFPPGVRDNFVTLLRDRGDPSILEAFEDVDSAQYQSFLWITSDPNYFDYGTDRVVQRYVLGVLALTLRDDPTPARKRKLQDDDDNSIRSGASVLSNWLAYSDECSWYSSSATMCNNQGLVNRLELRNLNLLGTIPMELSLLSNSLENLFLNGNQLTGTIPTQLGVLTRLDRLQLTANDLEGSIPSELAEIQDMELLGLGRNSLEGTLPPELGQLDKMTIFDVAANDITGTIPTEYGEMGALENLNFKSNQLTGTIPRQFTWLTQLEKLELGFNMLFGELPDRICNFRNLESLSVDCLLVDCDCCTNCGNPDAPVPTAMPTETPTREPTSPTKAPTPQPTAEPTLEPSPQPTPCRSKIETTNNCLTAGASIELSFVNCDAADDDWIGVYPSFVNPDDLGLSPVLWVWTCGSQGCRGAVEKGTIELTEAHVGEGTNGEWPLTQGDYQAFLIRRNPGGPYSAHAASDEFEVRRNNC